jgi:tRNA (cmo5U34)-methyltransferase
MSGKADSWRREDLSKRYLEGVRSAIPLAEYQIQIILTIIRKTELEIKSFLDLGCGDGILGRAILSEYPEVKGVFLDFSDAMIEAARQKISKSNGRVSFVTEDYGKPSWIKSVSGYGGFDVIVSGLSIHHQKDERKREVYQEIFNLLAPGGLFLNLEHVSSPSPFLQHLFEEFFVDSIYDYHNALDPDKTREEIASNYYNNPLRDANILTPVDTQCSWLQQIGFKEVDCYLKIFEIALFGGMKPK